jgi:hypothetical protein
MAGNDSEAKNIKMYKQYIKTRLLFVNVDQD